MNLKHLKLYGHNKKLAPGTQQFIKIWTAISRHRSKWHGLLAIYHLANHYCSDKDDPQCDIDYDAPLGPISIHFAKSSFFYPGSLCCAHHYDGAKPPECA